MTTKLACLAAVGAAVLLPAVDGFAFLPGALNGGLVSRGARIQAVAPRVGRARVALSMAVDGDKHQKKPKPTLDRVNFPSDMKGLSMEQLKSLCDELRWEVIEAVSQTGGHLSSSLGVVELTVALHYVFDAPVDKIIWDVAHQAYPHKMLTGRRDRFPSLRQWGGLSGFTKRKESE